MSTWLDTPGVRKRPFCGQDHLVTALAGENAGLAVTLNRGGSALPPLAASPVYGQHHPVDMTIVCIDILEKILIESRKSNGQPLLSSDTVASGLDGSSNKTDRTRKRGNSPPPRAFVAQASVTENDVASKGDVW
jgi:hypothetical protein